MGFFQDTVVNKYLKSNDSNTINQAYIRYKDHFHNLRIQENIRNSKEEQYQGEFLIDLFVKILGYTKNPHDNFNLTTEYKNVKDSKKADGAILINGVVKAVIELKGTNTTDLGKIEEQAFGYKNNQPECIYVITSNFEKLRLYIDNAIEHIEFNLFTLNFKDFEQLYLCLAYENIEKNIPKKIKDESLSEEDVITKKLYKDYSIFKSELFHNIVLLNPDINSIDLFQKTQKLIDRFLFLFFAEDRSLLPPNSVRLILSDWRDLQDRDEDIGLYDRFKKYFEYLNTGYKGKRYEVFAYNGGLFKLDDILDVLKIDDELLYKHTLKLSEYNFNSEVDVNILGHIFENSLNELDELKAQSEGEAIDRKKTRRKKDGVFYTPKYITKYIVDNTVGKLCIEKKQEIDIKDEDYIYDKKRPKKTTLASIDKLNQYKAWLLQLTICDPACGSGAFLNQALDFLIKEHKYVDELQAKLLGEALVFSDIEKSILENNLYGVDINEESVEIAKLSLWIRTAQPNRKLNDLNNNIKCGNSLIDDPDIAGDKAFNWLYEFPDVFSKGGFDVVIGNPPYGILIDKTEQNYFTKHFPLTKYKTNLYILFIERMLQIFDKGIIHFIIPKSLLFNSYYELIRRELIIKTELNELFTITEKVFEDAEVGGSLIIKFTINKKENKSSVLRLIQAEKIHNFITGVGLIENNIPQEYFLTVPNCEISIISSELRTLTQKLNSLKTLKDFYTLKNGLNPGNIKHILISDTKDSEKHKPIIWGKDITRYKIDWSGQYINYDDTIGNRINIKDIKSKEGMQTQTRIDFALRSPDMFNNRKIVIRKTGDSLIGSLDENQFYFDTLAHGIYERNNSYKLEVILPILNSKSATTFYRLLHDIKGKVFAKISLENLASFPIPYISIDNQGWLINVAVRNATLNKEYNDQIEKLQRTLKRKFELNALPNKLQDWHLLSYADFIKELAKMKIKLTLSEEAEWEEYFNSERKKALDILAEIESTDKEIDQMVYKLYELTEEEIKIVETSN